jgi:carbamoyltransferase
MRVLGISPLDKDSTVSFVENGRILFACGEERLSRVKLQDGFPSLALELGLKRTGWTLDSIDVVAYSFFDGKEEARLIKESQDYDTKWQRNASSEPSLAILRQRADGSYRPDLTTSVPGLDPAKEFADRKTWWKRKAYEQALRSGTFDRMAHDRSFKKWIELAVADHMKWTEVLETELGKRGLLGKLKRFNHHLCHAANAFYASGFDRSLVISFDGYGSGNCGAIYVGSDKGLEKLHEFKFPNSLGQFYEYVTSALGFRPSRHEGKIVGLAAYGNPEVVGPILRSRFEGLDEGDIRIVNASNYYLSRYLAQNFAMRDVAAAYQTVLEEVAKKVAGYWLKKTGCEYVCLSGGVNANVKLNQRIQECEGVKGVYVYPNMGDGGCGTGAAYVASVESGIRPERVDSVYLGPDYSDEEIESCLKAAGVHYKRLQEPEVEIAAELAKNRIVGRFNGRMEYGPRALGNRSVLYQAKEPEVNLWLNHQLGRTEFMPFAPAALDESKHELFKNIEGGERTAQFMTITFDCTEKMCKESPAAVHIDKTARPQLVTAQSNPSFHKLLTEYKKLTGLSVLINTSFNMHEEPIVCSPEDAVRAFLDGRIDMLAIGNYLAFHPQLEEIDRERSHLDKTTSV